MGIAWCGEVRIVAFAFQTVRCGAVRCGSVKNGQNRTAAHRDCTIANDLILKAPRPSHGLNSSESRTVWFGADFDIYNRTVRCGAV